MGVLGVAGGWLADPLNLPFNFLFLDGVPSPSPSGAAVVALPALRLSMMFSIVRPNGWAGDWHES